MLYKIAKGAVTESHYGLTLAKVVPLPAGVVERATYVAKKLERHKLKTKRTSATVIQERRRKLILDLKEHLVQTHNGALEGDVLATWLKALQKEFVTRMSTIDAEEARVGQDSESEEDQDEEMRSRSEYDHEEERPSTQASQPSVITIDSYMSSTASPSMIRAVSESASGVRAVSENDR